jgi:hypothetical protein
MTPAALRKVRAALNEIEQAQNHLANACSELSPVIGLIKEYERLGELCDKVKAEWHRLNGLDGPFRLDSEPKSRPEGVP